jgi:FtsZ-interacting cell division protein ZipA
MVGPMPVPEPASTAAIESAAVLLPPALPDTPPPPMKVEWPPENARRIVTLRIVPTGTDRLPGRTLRQALTGCGFRHGEFGIFHLPDDEGRVILSAASLVQPGTLDPTGMDFQRFPGLNVFAVLPGPQSAERALERLGQLAIELSARVSGRVHDDQGATLTTGTVSAWRKRMLSTLEPTPSANVASGSNAAAAGPAD